MTKQQGLGKGLGSLIPSKIKAQSSNGKESIVEVPIDKIKANPHQPRNEFAEGSMQQLVDSIKEHGILQPIILSETKEGFELIAGERRLRASKILKLKIVPAIIRAAEEQQKLELALVENLHRENLNALEKAIALKKLIEQFSYTQEKVAKKVGQSRAAVANLLRLLQLPAEIQKALRAGRLSEGHARALLSIKDQKEQMAVFNKMKLGNWTVRDVEKVGKRSSGARLKNGQLKVDAALMQNEEDLTRVLSSKVKIKKRGQRGQIIIEFYSEEELGELIKRLKA